MDAAANDRVARGVSTLEDELKRLAGAFPGEQLAKETDKFKTKLKETETTAKQTAATLKAEARVLSATASAITDGLEKQRTAVIKNLAGQLQGLSTLSLATGTALIGGILGFANNYVANAKEATAVTVGWKAAQESLNQSQARFGAVLAQESLPLLEEAARLADKASRFVEQNPDIVSAALNAGKVLVGLGILGTLVSRGIKLVADVRQLATIPIQLQAANLQDQAADKQLKAALLKAKELGVDVPSGPNGAAPGLLGSLTSPLAIASLVVGVVAASDLLAKNILKLEDVMYESAIKTGRGIEFLVPILGSLESVVANIAPLANAFLNVRRSLARDIPLIANILNSSDDVSSGPGSIGGRSGAGTAIRGISPEVLRAYEQYRKEDLAATQSYLAEKKSIEQNAIEATSKANQNYLQSVRQVTGQLSSALANATASYNREVARAEADNTRQRAQIIRDGGQEIARIEEELQETLRKNRLEHENRVADLTSARDALGLAKEAERFNQEQNEARRETNREIAQRRQDIAQRLSDLQQSYEQERAQRLADYQAQIGEIRANAAQQLAELRQKHAEELRQIQIDRNSRLRELNNTLNEERRQRHAAFIAQVRDLDATLLGEKNLRDRYQADMLRDLDSFLAQYRAKLGSIGSSLPGRADGGYASGPINTGERGYEYVLSNRTTRAAEAMIGGRLTQQGLLAALSGMGGGTNVTWNDQRRFSGEYTHALRRANRDDTLQILEQVFK